MSLPTGTITMLFCDIEGSTVLLATLGERWADALATERAILRAVFEENGGIEMGTEGDSFFVVFTSAGSAVRAAIEGQRRLQSCSWPNGVDVRVRMGLHTGEPRRHEDGYVGLDVHRAARVASVASGAQIVMSKATHLLAPELDGNALARDLGEHRLKDIGTPEHLYDIVAPGLVSEFPPLRSLGTRASLPRPATKMVGREALLSELEELTAHPETRLLTLTGPGGTGKTRVAVSLAAVLEHRYPMGVFFVDLNTADRAAVMWAGIAEAVGAPADAGTQPHERALQTLVGRRTLLLLDNLEQVVDADVVVSTLLTELPELTVLATSRRPLHLIAEQEVQVPPLSVPPHSDDAAEASDGNGSDGAVELFAVRAAMTNPAFRLTDANRADVVELCHRLDGLPLAIELAAARTKLLSPHALLTRLDLRLGEGVVAADRVERQRTIGATIAWSYDLLDSSAQRVFRCLGVFAGTFDLDAAQAVVGVEGADPLDVVAHLVNISLLQAEEGKDGEPRLRMLETVRSFARGRLDESGECDTVRMRHAHWCVGVAEEVERLLSGASRMAALDRVTEVEEELRAALDWCLHPGSKVGSERPRCGYRILKSLTQYWYQLGYIAEGRGWHARGIAAFEGEESREAAMALHGMGIMTAQENDTKTAIALFTRALGIARALGDQDIEAREANSLGIVYREAGELRQARALVELSLHLARQLGNLRREATALTNLVLILTDAGDFEAAVGAAQQALAPRLSQDDPWGVAINRVNLTLPILRTSNPAAAFDHLSAIATETLALCDVELSIDVVESFAAVLAEAGDGRGAARMLGAADAARESVGLPRSKPSQRLLDTSLGPARRGLEAAAWADTYAEGTRLTLEAAVAQALASDVRLPAG